MIRDIQALRDTGQVWRHVAELDIPPAAWRAAIRETARLEGIRIRTFLMPSLDNAPVRSEPAGDRPDDVPAQMVCAVRADVAPDAPEGRTDPLWWRRVDDLPVTVGTWRSMVRRTARRERVAIRTFPHPTQLRRSRRPERPGGLRSMDRSVAGHAAVYCPRRCQPAHPTVAWGDR